MQNIRTHPAYGVGENGVGSQPVVPWDFEHVSEGDPAYGDVSVSGMPAQGWTYDLEIRRGPRGEELWALTSFLEPARTYVKTKKYRWASIAMTFSAIDPKSGKNVGALITSIALTNNPFIEGMAQLVAAKG